MRLRTELGGDPTQVSRARRLVSSELAGWRIDADAADITVLLVSELVTNALLHGSPPIRLGISPTATGLRVEVYDGDADRLPAVQQIRLDLPGGRGMRLVEALSARWGAAVTADGKCVWCELDCEHSSDDRRP
ncbi:MAG: ATP-binding protein [Actinomycetes bacterium]